LGTSGENGLLAGGYLTATQAIQHIDDQLSPSNASPLINAFQAVNILVALSAVDGSEVEIGVTDGNSSCLVRAPGTTSARYVVMPMRL